MGELASLSPLQCKECPFLCCNEQSTCYNCHCYLDLSLQLDDYCDGIYKSPVECPLKTGLIITIKESKGRLYIGNSYQ